jgi:ABC-type antimicrobial peptide transport system permease subunit
MAVGATPRQIGSLILKHALQWTVIGIAIGLAGTLIATRFLGNLLFGVAPVNFFLFSAEALFLLAVVGTAALVPAVRASRIDPTVVLRQE